MSSLSADGVVAFDVIDVRLLQSIKTPYVSASLVMKLVRFRVFNLLQPENIHFTDVTLFILNLLTSRLVKPEHHVAGLPFAEFLHPSMVLHLAS